MVAAVAIAAFFLALFYNSGGRGSGGQVIDIPVPLPTEANQVLQSTAEGKAIWTRSIGSLDSVESKSITGLTYGGSTMALSGTVLGRVLKGSEVQYNLQQVETYDVAPSAPGPYLLSFSAFHYAGAQLRSSLPGVTTITVQLPSVGATPDDVPVGAPPGDAWTLLLLIAAPSATNFLTSVTLSVPVMGAMQYMPAAAQLVDGAQRFELFKDSSTTYQLMPWG